MIFRAGTRLQVENINVLFKETGLGDCISQLPVVKYILDKYDHVSLHMWVPDYIEELARHLLPKVDNLVIKPFSKAEKEYNDKYATIKTIAEMGAPNGLRMHLTEVAFSNLLQIGVENKYKNYLKIKPEQIDVSNFKLPEKYVVIATGRTSPVREFLPEFINELIEHVNSKGYTPVFLGREDSPTGLILGDCHAIKNNCIHGKFDKVKIHYDRGINLINKTTLLESLKIINGAKTIMGVDCGLLHLAACTDIPIVGGFTTVDPKTRLPYRNNKLGWNFYSVVPNESLTCRFCQTNMLFVYDHNFVKCFYKDAKCIDLMKPKIFIQALELIGVK